MKSFLKKFFIFSKKLCQVFEHLFSSFFAGRRNNLFLQTDDRSHITALTQLVPDVASTYAYCRDYIFYAFSFL